MKLCPHCGAEIHTPDWSCSACGWSVGVIAGFPALAPSLSDSSESYRPEFHHELASLEARNFWFQARNRLIVDAMRDHFPKMNSMLEIGCGTGFVLAAIRRAFPSAALTGTELLSSGLAVAAARVPDVRWLQADARQLPFVDEFACAGAFDVLEHIDDDGAVLSSLYRSVLPGGGIVISVPQHPWLWSDRDTLARHVRRYSASQLKQRMEHAGFAVVALRSFVSLLLPLVWLSRRASIRNDSDDALSELRIPRVVNSAFAMAMQLEHALGRLGVRFAFGSSLLAVGRKP
jgi:SAM-dependent methyltransferase